MRRSPSSLLAALVLLVALEPAAAADRGLGKDVFASECSECHSVQPGKNKKGPSLFAVLGRKAGEQPDFKYSDAMRASGWTWDAEALRRYVSQPRRALPGGTMKYDGLADAAALEDLLAYLGTLK